VGTNIPPNLGRIINAAGLEEGIDEALVFTPSSKGGRWSCTRQALENDRSIRFQAGISAMSERRTRRQGKQVRHKITGLMHDVDAEVAVFNADMNVHSEDQQAASDFGHCFEVFGVSIVVSDGLFGPARKGVSTGSSNLETVGIS